MPPHNGARVNISDTNTSSQAFQRTVLNTLRHRITGEIGTLNRKIPTNVLSLYVPEVTSGQRGHQKFPAITLDRHMVEK